MALEIERKFLVKNESWRGAVEREWRILQGYLATSGDLTVRVRMRDGAAFLTIKGPPRGLVRSEFEYAIPPADGEAMLRELTILPLIDKMRYRVPCGAHYWDVDVFTGDNAGLVLAEIELKREHESFEHPSWLGLDVTDDLRYSNANLARRPFKEW
ncbi:CYTH domain-containing protein [uncultured Thiodictyon sp.]|uniref:CYTH domain-containing protein n=1 Tax=uncultured Thiodictyon sp. TaxID=1846217 RepID=UPI0025E37023|nr:CYTH domain-containing protein [uncultured Thiodictyon sp.]